MSARLTAALVFALPAAALAQDTVPTGSMLPLVSHETCSDAGALPSLLKVNGSGLEYVLAPFTEEGEKPTTVVVRRGAEVTREGIGFQRVTADPKPEPAIGTVDLTVEAVLCLTRMSAELTSGQWTMKSEDEATPFSIGGDIPSTEMMVREVAYSSDGGVTVRLEVSLSGELLAESSDQYVLRANYDVVIPVAESQ